MTVEYVFATHFSHANCTELVSDEDISFTTLRLLCNFTHIQSSKYAIESWAYAGGRETHVPAIFNLFFFEPKIADILENTGISHKNCAKIAINFGSKPISYKNWTKIANSLCEIASRRKIVESWGRIFSLQLWKVSAKLWLAASFVENLANAPNLISVTEILRGPLDRVLIL